MDRRAVIVVAVGGAAGATARWLTGEIIDHRITALFVVNTVGAMLFGAVTNGALRANATRNLLVGIGFCGGLTTFSSFAVEVAVRLDDGRPIDGLGVTVASLILGVGAFLVGGATRRSTT